jgi:hypothetical protein
MVEVLAREGIKLVHKGIRHFTVKQDYKIIVNLLKLDIDKENLKTKDIYNFGVN